jgi:transcriptional regulator with XRE-family HTH domain
MAVEGSEGSAEEHGCALWPEDFGERLQRLMEMADLSRRDLADLLGVRESTVQKWLKGGEPTGGNYWGLMQVAIRVPGGFPLLLYGDPCAKVGAEE